SHEVQSHVPPVFLGRDHELAPVTLQQSPVLSVLQLTNSLRGYDLRTAATAGSFAVFGDGANPPLRSSLRPCKFDFIRTPSRDRHIGGGGGGPLFFFCWGGGKKTQKNP